MSVTPANPTNPWDDYPVADVAAHLERLSAEAPGIGIRDACLLLSAADRLRETAAAEEATPRYSEDYVRGHLAGFAKGAASTVDDEVVRLRAIRSAWGHLLLHLAVDIDMPDDVAEVDLPEHVGAAIERIVAATNKATAELAEMTIDLTSVDAGRILDIATALRQAVTP